MSRLPRSFREDLEKLKNMPLKERLLFAAEYYWLWILGIAGGAALAVFLAVRLIAGPPVYDLYVVFANTRADAGNRSEIWRDFQEASGYGRDGRQLVFDAACYFDYTQNQARGNVYYDAFVALTDASVLDAVTMESGQLSALAQSGRLLDWNEDRCASLLAKYGDRLVFFRPPDGGKEIPVGVDVSDSLLVTRYGVYGGDCALGIGAQSVRLAETERFLDFILSGG